jgi:hypothetical protein
VERDYSASDQDNVHMAQAGESLATVAGKLGISEQSLQDANPGLSNPNSLNPGQYIKLPDVASDPAAGDTIGSGPPQDTITDEHPTRAAGTQGSSPMCGLEANFALLKLQDSEIDTLKGSAKGAGLTDAEVAKLGTTLQNLPPRDRAKDIKLVKDALASDNPDRAVRTYMDVAPKRAAHPDRITPDIERTLVMGVGKSGTDQAVGHKGVIGETQAGQAADALIQMSKSDFKAINGALSEAGKGRVHNKNASAGTEGALILKAVAAREDKLTSLSGVDKAKNKAGKPSSVAGEVTAFAKSIRNQDRSKVVDQTTVLGLSNPDKALEQRWNDSCGPTTAQMTKADSDPIYAQALNKEGVHSTDTSGSIAAEQKAVLEANSGVAKPRGTPGTGIVLDPALNTLSSPSTQRTYSAQWAGNTPGSRTAAMDTMEDNLKHGVDVPIRVGWPGGGGHFELASDVKGKPPSREFLITDPWKGHTMWVKEADIAAGNTNFSAGNGNLTHIYPGTPKP